MSESETPSELEMLERFENREQRVVAVREYSVLILNRSRDTAVVRLHSCPACGHTFKLNGRSKRFHLQTHDPEDFGLTPLWD